MWHHFSWITEVPVLVSGPQKLLGWGTSDFWTRVMMLVCQMFGRPNPIQEREERGVVQPVPFCKIKKFSVFSPSSARTSFGASPEKRFAESGARRSGRNQRIAPAFQGELKKNNCIFVEKLLHFSLS